MPVQRGPPAELHATDLPFPAGGVDAVVLDADRPALVLGSTQSPASVDEAAAVAGGVDVVRRRSGGGAVLLVPGEHLWVDVLLGRGDRRWTDDVSASPIWLGDAWAAALAAVGVGGDIDVHRGAMRRSGLSDLVCFAGLAPGEVTVGGGKAVGISQRRTRAGARFQCVVLTRWEPAAFGRLLPGVDAPALAEVAVATVAAAPGDLAVALARALGV